MSDPGYTAETAPPRFRDYYKELEPDPNADYGTFFPMAQDRTTGKMRWAMPSAARDTVGGWLDLLAGLDSGEVTPRAAMQIGMGGLGAGAAFAPRGALATGGAPLELAMDEVSRLERARQMGFQVDRPLYHGTPAPDFPAFQVVAPWEAVRTARAPGISTAETPALAENFAIPEVRARVGLMGPPGNPQFPEGTPRILPLFARSENESRLTLRPDDNWRDVWRAVAGAFDAGHDAIGLQNYRMFPELGPQTIWTFRDPAQLRSRFAAFDPAKRDSSDLMAGFAVPGPAPAPGFRVTPQNDATGLANYRRMIDDERVY